MVPGGVEAWMLLLVTELLGWSCVTGLQRDAATASALRSSLNPANVPGAVATAGSRSSDRTAALGVVPGSPAVRKNNLGRYVIAEPSLTCVDDVVLGTSSSNSLSLVVSPTSAVKSSNHSTFEATRNSTLLDPMTSISSFALAPSVAGETDVLPLATATVPTSAQLPPSSKAKIPIRNSNVGSNAKVIVDELTQETLSPEEQVSRFYKYIDDLTANIRVPTDTDEIFDAVVGRASSGNPVDFISSAFHPALKTLPTTPSAGLILQPTTRTINTRPFSPTRNLEFAIASSRTLTLPIASSTFLAPQGL